MIDQCGRNIDYLRVSVTDRCNLRCIYCMPKEGLRLVDRCEILSREEIIRICKVMAQLGIKKIKLTGGEPLVRQGVPSLVENLKALPGIEKVTLTTNGSLLAPQMELLARAGLDGLNISLDTLDAACFQKITRRDELSMVKEGIKAALSFPKISVKINCVPLGLEEQDLCEIAAIGKDAPIHVRFIEMMPIGFGREFRGMSEEEVVSLLEKKFGKMTPYTGESLGNGPCHYYNIDGFTGKIGFISAISHKFCRECNRIRLTSQGYLKTCLQYTAGRDLRRILREGGSDEDLKKEILEALKEKPVGHEFLEKEKKDDTENLCMSQIGG